MNIRVDLNTPINDGMEVVFRSPVDCSQITGLIVYSGNDPKEFMFADAHGNNVGDIDHLFAENVVVKVILDVTTGMAFVQNADTNKYIESTFIKTVNGVGPDENGNVTVSGGGGTGGDIDLSDYATKEEMQQMYDDLTVNDNEAINRAETALSYAADAMGAAENAQYAAETARQLAEGVGSYVDSEIARVEGSIGDIESALDAIIAMQSNLIGGNA